jgi:serpin B
VRLLAVALTAAIAVGACDSALVAPPTEQPTPWAWQTSAWPDYSPLPTATPESSPSEEATPTASDSTGPDGFTLAMGNIRLLQPADDYGVRAGNEVNDFGFDLLRRLDAEGNLCASPTSIALALAMVRAGARGDTAAEMDKVLRSLGSDAQASDIFALLQSLNAITYYQDWYPDDPLATPDPSVDPAVELTISNAAFVQQDMTLEQAYLDALVSRYGAGLGLLDFKNDPEAARLLINRWASDRTKGRIPEVLQPGDITPATRIALANAIYLKAAWGSPFDKAQTASRTFTRAGGSRVSVPTMAIDREFAYAAGHGWRAVDVPFTNYGLSMTIIVPEDMSSFVASLNSAKLNSILRQESVYDVDLTLPRFSVDSRFDLKQVLAAMGMPTAFSDDADFSGITADERLLIQGVIHQANIDVVEEGTTAAAVTVVTGATMGGPGDDTPPPIPHVKFHVDKPFLYFIRDTQTGAILFMGRIDDPSAQG